MEIQFGYYPYVIPLVLARVTAVIFAVPFFGSDRVPPTLRAAMAVVITMVLLPVVPDEWAELARGMNTLPELLVAILSEVMLGAAVGLICHVFQGICSVSGSLQGRSSSLMMARSLDPMSGATSNIMAAILQTLFVLLVLLNNAHLVLLKLVSSSFTTHFGAMEWMTSDFFGLIITVGSVMFDWGLKMAMPVMCAAIIVDVCMGLITRLAPDFNVLFLSMPIRLSICICLFGLVVRFGNDLFVDIIEQMLVRCANVLGV